MSFDKLFQFFALPRRMSLKGRLIALMIGLLVAFIWALVLISSTVLQRQLEQLLSDQQFAITGRLAAEVDHKLKDNIAGLTRAAEGLPSNLTHATLQPVLAARPLMHVVFTGGLAVLDLDGRVIADYPEVAGRRAADYGDRDYFRQVLASGKPYINKPVLGSLFKRPILVMAVPVFDAGGRVRAVLAGVIDLTTPNFLGFVADPTRAGTGEYFVVSLRDRMIVAATDSRRVMTSLPARGANLQVDRMAEGYEGSGIAVSSEGISKLYSGKRVPTADWLVIAALRTEVAFTPIRIMRNYLFVIAAILTLLAIFLVRWVTGRVLLPLEEAATAMRGMSRGEAPLTLLPLRRDDEVGQLIGNFNRLVVDRTRHEAALAESEQRFRLLVESAPDAIYVQVGWRFAYANGAALALFGAQENRELMGRTVLDQIHPEYREIVAERIRALNERREALPVQEQVYLRLDGMPVQVEVSAVPFCYEAEHGSLVFVRDISERKRADAAIRASEARFRSLFGHMLGGFAYCRMIWVNGIAEDFIYLDVNPAFVKLTGLHDVVGRAVSAVIPGIRAANPELFEIYGRVAAGGGPERFETYLPGLDHWFDLAVYCPEPDCFVAVFDVITERKRAEQAQRRLNRALRLLSECNTALVHAEREQSLLDEICRLVVERGGYRLAWVGYADDPAGAAVRQAASAGSRDVALDSRQAAQAMSSRTVQLSHGEDAGLAGSVIALPMTSGGRCFGALSIHADAVDAFVGDELSLLLELASDLAFGIDTLRLRQQRVIAEEKLAFLAHHDTLTGLPNRLLLRDRFDHALNVAQREQSGVALLFLDLDNFKQVNDSLGHDMGDRLLNAVVKRLQGCIRDADTISRQGGDEFIVLLGSVSDLVAIGRVAQQILDIAQEPFEIDGTPLNTSFSIGISCYPEDGADFDTLLKNADTALYHVKDSGRAAYHFYSAQMNVDAVGRMQLQGQLRNAVRRQEFLLHYQPQVDIGSGRIVGIEALLRWQPGDGGAMVPPGSFIPVAEQSGLIIPIGEWVLYEACRQAMLWHQGGFPELTMAVNLSALQFRRGNILATVASALKASGLPASCLELELTESILLQDTESAMRTLHELKQMGVLLSIDDFGTGYSSLSYLKRLAVDKLKIDQSFVRDIAEDPDDAAIVRAIVQMGHTLQLTVIAEGVETEPQLAFLASCGCDEAQGYFFSRPQAAAEIGRLLGAGG